MKHSPDVQLRLSKINKFSSGGVVKRHKKQKEHV